ncbi:MAG: MarR family transcriptional regulator [Bryobacteraceae bacterium]
MAKAKSKPGRLIGGPEETAFLSIVRTAEVVSHPLVQLLKTHELSVTQYNVLRILRGAADGLTCGEIANRMITRDPDITRLLDRLEKRNLIERARDRKDRRAVLTRITPHGLEFLAALDEPVQQTHRQTLGHLGAQRLAQLSDLLAVCRDKDS